MTSKEAIKLMMEGKKLTPQILLHRRMGDYQRWPVSIRRWREGTETFVLGR